MEVFTFPVDESTVTEKLKIKLFPCSKNWFLQRIDISEFYNTQNDDVNLKDVYNVIDVYNQTKFPVSFR